jgi:hypothetical protein
MRMRRNSANESNSSSSEHNKTHQDVQFSTTTTTTNRTASSCTDKMSTTTNNNMGNNNEEHQASTDNALSYQRVVNLETESDHDVLSDLSLGNLQSSVAARHCVRNFILMSALFSANHGCVVGTYPKDKNNSTLVGPEETSTSVTATHSH